MKYQVVHAVEGRYRIQIPQLAIDPAYVSKLQNEVQALKFVTSVRMNPEARSMIVTYKANKVTGQAMLDFLQAAIEGGNGTSASQTPPAATVTTPAPSASPSSEQPETAAATAPTTPERQPSTATPATAPPAPSAVTTPVVDAVNLEQDLWEAPVAATPEAPTHSGTSKPSPPSSSPQAAGTESSSDSAPDQSSEPELLRDVEDDSAYPLTPLATTALAKRLGVSTQALTRYRTKPDFCDWCQKRDPEGIVWTYHATSKTFHAIKPASPLNLLKVEEIAGGVVGGSVGGTIGGVVGETVGAVLMGPAGMIVGDAIGTLVGDALGAELGREAVDGAMQPKQERSPTLGASAPAPIPSEPEEQTAVTTHAHSDSSKLSEEVVGASVEEFCKVCGEVVGEALLGEEGKGIGETVGEVVGTVVETVLEKPAEQEQTSAEATPEELAAEAEETAPPDRPLEPTATPATTTGQVASRKKSTAKSTKRGSSKRK